MVDPVPAGTALARALHVLRSAPRAAVLVDGRSGSGKTVFAAALAARAHARLLRLDDLYPGWDGLDAAAGTLVDRVLLPRRAGAGASVRGWDWSADRIGRPVAVPVDGPLVVEGCGALSRAAAALADLGVWLDLDDADRRRRALARDGAAFAPHWERWARQERRFLARERPRAAADLVVDGRRFPDRLFSERSARAQ